MMDDEVKRRIIDNRFVFHLRTQNRIDEEQFAGLCADLKLLAERWRRETVIDKELVSYLVVDLNVTRNMAESARQSPNESAFWDAYLELDRLILEEVLVVPDDLRTWEPHWLD